MVNLSPSSVQSYFSFYAIDGTRFHCPAAWKYGREWESIGEPDSFTTRGLLAHQLLAGEIQPHEVQDEQTIKVFQKLHALRENSGLKLIHESREQWMKPFSIVPGVSWRRRPDGLAENQSGEEVFLDYKAQGNWKIILDKYASSIAPKALTFQSIGYLVPYPKANKWPRKIVYLIAGFRGLGQIFEYVYDKADHQNLLEAITQIRDAIKKDRFPKIRDNHCAKCPFMSLCFQQPGFKEQYRRKK